VVAWIQLNLTLIPTVLRVSPSSPRTVPSFRRINTTCLVGLDLDDSLLHRARNYPCPYDAQLAYEIDRGYIWSQSIESNMAMDLIDLHTRRAYRSTFDRRQGHVQICFDGVTSYHLRSTYIPNHTQYRPYTYPYAIMCARLLSLSGHSTIYICEENFVTSRTKLSCFPVRVGLHLAHRLAMGVEHLPTPHHAVHHRRPLLLNRLALLPFEFLLSSFVEESFTLLHSYERRSLWWCYFPDILSPISVQIFSLAV
jgi:hypothetical protein